MRQRYRDGLPGRHLPNGGNTLSRPADFSTFHLSLPCCRPSLSVPENASCFGPEVGFAQAQSSPSTVPRLRVVGIVEGIPVEGGQIGAQRRVRTIRDEYDAMVRQVARSEVPQLVGPTGVALLPDPTNDDDFTRAVDLAARAIVAGLDPIEARLAANAELLRSGLDVVALRSGDLRRHSDAVRAIRDDGDAELLFRLMLERYD